MKVSLYKGFSKVGEFDSILEAKKNAPLEDGVYNLIGFGYRSSWYVINGKIYGGE